MEHFNESTQKESTNVTTILDSNISENSKQSAENVETKNISSIKENKKGSYDFQSRTTTKNEYKTEATNIQSQVVDKPDDSSDSTEESMDVSSTEDDVDDNYEKNHNEAQQVEVSVEKKPQNVADKECNNITNENKPKHFQCEQTEEDELLKSDNEDDIEGHTGSAKQEMNSMSMEQEEELLKSEDEEEEISKYIDDEIPNKTLKINESEEKEQEQNLETESDNSNESKVDLQYRHEAQIGVVSTENVNSNESVHPNENVSDECSQQLETEPGSDSNQSERHTDITLMQKLRKNAENHRILYQFDLDDDSSSQGNFQYKKSLQADLSDDKNERNLDDSSTNDREFERGSSRESLSDATDIEHFNKNEEEETYKDDFENSKSVSEPDRSYSNSPIAPPSDADNETDHLSAKSVKLAAANSIDEMTKHEISTFQSPQESSPKSERSSSEEDNYSTDQHNDEVNKRKEGSSKSSDTWNSTAKNVRMGLENDNSENQKQVIFDNSSKSNERRSSSSISKTLEKNDNSFSPKLNGGRDSENECNEREQNDNSNVSCFRHDEAEDAKSPSSSLNSHALVTSPQQSSLYKLQHKECFESSFRKEPNEKPEIYNDQKILEESDNESNLQINEVSQECENNDKKQNLSVVQSFVNPNQDEEGSRSSLASSASYSTTTSSSQHLVIDHPMDDVKVEKVLPLKISLKRKLSNLSDDSLSVPPQEKQVRVHKDNEEDDNTTPTSYSEEVREDQSKATLELLPSDENLYSSETARKNYSEEKINNLDPLIASALDKNKEKNQFLACHSDLASLSFKSLLFERLENPPAMPNTVKNLDLPPHAATSVTYATTQVTVPPVLPTQSLPAPTSTEVTKYLCFKCKTGSFESFAALTEHQATCLISNSLFPIKQMPMQTNSLPLTPPVNTLTNSNILSETKETTTTAIELKEIITPPTQTAVPSIKLRYYKCSTCNTFHENWNLFLHILEQHNRYMCLYCVRFFPTAEKLALHLEIKHDLEQNHFNTEEALRDSIPVFDGNALESRLLMCCTCQHIFMESEQFSQHDCSDFIKACLGCGQKGRHSNDCKSNPDSKRFSKIKKKKDKSIQLSEVVPSSPNRNDRNELDCVIPPVTINKTNFKPTIISNSNLNCDSGRGENHQRPPPNRSMHSEDSNSSSNMVIDESCSMSHMPPAQIQPQEHSNTNESLGIDQPNSCKQIEPDLPAEREFNMDRSTPQPPVKLIVPKFKLRVPKEFQKSVDDALSTSDSEDEEEIDNDHEGEEVEEAEQDSKDANETENYSGPIMKSALEHFVKKEAAVDAAQNSLLAESTPANSQDMEIDRNSATESAANSQSDAAYESGNKSTKSSLLQDDDDSLDEPNSNLVRIMQEIERTKLDIQRTKKTSNRHNKSHSLPRQPALSQSSNRTADRNWSPTPPASPNSRSYTPRRLTASQTVDEQLQKNAQQPLCLLPPPSPIKQLGIAQERRDTIGSDMMDIDETITSQPTQTVSCDKLLRLKDQNSLNISQNEKSSPQHVDEVNQKAHNETSVSDLNNFVLQNEGELSSSLVTERQQGNENDKNKFVFEGVPKANSPVVTENMQLPLAQLKENENDKESAGEADAEGDEAGNDTEIDVCGTKELGENIQVTDSEKVLEGEKLPPADGIEVANDDIVAVDMKLDRPLDKYDVIDFVRICLKTVYPLCLFCNHARRIAVNGKSLVLHMIAHHRLTAAVDSITAEELQPATIVAKLKTFLPEVEQHYFNANSYCTYGEGAFTHHLNERIFECFQCRFVTSTHKELYLHNRKMHLRTAILCFMCRANFFSFSEILCHICPGVANKVSIFDIKFRCCLCNLDNIPSPFRLMVHLRKKHFACDVCLEDCRDQSRLSSHVWKHKLHHLCYRCGIAYRNKLDITKHLFWKHGTESTICKKCLQKKWRHVYHFCIPPATFTCEVCNLCFSKAMYLRVHKRLHSGDLRYPCVEDNCEEKFISRKLLLKHALVHQELPSAGLAEQEASENKENEFGTTQESTEENFKSQIDVENIKQEVIAIKKEPLDESEMEGQTQTLLKGVNCEVVDKLEAEEQKIQSGDVKDPKNEEIKDKKHLGSSETRKKRKKSKRSKELLEDLNLTAPNLSESDSSDDSGSDSDSKTKSEIDVLPRVMLSPPSEAENEDKENKSSEVVEPGQVLEIWKNFLKTQQDSSTVEELERLKATNEENKQPKRMPVHVACSDHDYCKIEPDPPALPDAPEPKLEQTKDVFKLPENEATSTPETSPTKRKQSKSPRGMSSKRSNASSSSSESSSSSDSSCSCGSNCSCSSSDSNSSSSSSSSDDSDSSQASNTSVRKRHRKKSERDRMRKRSESMSPLKQHKLSVSISEIINVDDEDAGKDPESIAERPPSLNKEPLIYESDLETNESETDEEFYDEHPQKLANELLAPKRAQLIAQTRLSPSHNFDIVENSRPSTPSLPEEVSTFEKPKIKVKKKKRDRKSSSKGQSLHTNHVAGSDQANATAHSNAAVNMPNNLIVPLATKQNSPPTGNVLNSVAESHINPTSNLYPLPQNNMPHSIYTLLPPAVFTEQSTLTPRPLTMTPYGNSHRMSEGSSCSDADASLKRSKRQRRPNKFYGYTSDDENLINGPPLMIGSRAFKPQPPPQLTWRKEDLPTPSKSILNNKNKTPKTPKMPAAPASPFGIAMSTSTTKKKSRSSLIGGEKSARKRPKVKSDTKGESKFPPIPTLKIRPSEIGLNNSYAKTGNYNTTDDTSSDDDTSKEHSFAANSFHPSAVSQAVSAVVPPIVLPSQPPPPPVPNTTAFNHRIPPALLPNPDFATLQYFKANNIRYPIRPPAGARQARDGESVYCYCRCPYDEVSEMIACDGENCLIEWFHFECVGIMVAPQGKWFCAECRPKYSEELYPSSIAGQLSNV